MNKNTFTAVKLAKGEMNVYDFGTVKLHAYKTNDFIDNEVFIVEKNGKAVIIESPCFFDNISELKGYLKGTEECGMLIAYHGAGASFLPGVPRYATKTLWNIPKTAEERHLSIILPLHSVRLLIIAFIR